MKPLVRNMISVAFALLVAVAGNTAASAGGGAGSTAGAASSDLCSPLGCYTSNSRFVGFYTVNGASPLCSESANSQITLTCTVSRAYTGTVGFSAAVDFSLIKDSLSAEYGVNASRSKTITISNNCTVTVGKRGGRVWAVPEYSKYEFLVRHRQIGGGGANDAVVGRGWIGVPSGIKCFSRNY